MTNPNPYQVNGKLLEGKVGVFMGVANQDSIVWHIALMAMAHGATVIISHHPAEALAKRASPLAESIGAMAVPCDVTIDESIDCAVETITKQHKKIDFLVYGPAFANKDELKGSYLNMNRENFAQAMDISCYSMSAVTKRFYPFMKECGGSILGLTYHGSTKVVPCYDLMGVAKAALEANIRYLAYYLGSDNIRVNGVSAGPVRTLAASRGIRGYDALEEYYEKNSPVERNITVADAAKACIYMLSDLSSGVTGEIHYVDNGFNIMGVKNPRTDDVDLSAYKGLF